MKYIFTLTFLLIGPSIFAVLPKNEQIIRSHIIKELKKNSSVPEYKITSEAPGINGAKHYYGIQTFNNLPIYHTEFNLTILNNEVINFNHNFIINPESLPNQEEFRLSPQQILFTLIGTQYIQTTEPELLENGKYKVDDKTLSDEPIIIQKMWLVKNNILIAVYDVSIYEKNHSHWYNTRIDAVKGLVINRNDWVTTCQLDIAQKTKSVSDKIIKPEETSVLLKNKTNANSAYNVFAYPLESPNHGNRSVVINPHNLDASPYGWHDVDGVAGEEYTITRGNNVYASEDKNDDNIPGFSPNGGSTLTFDEDFDITKSAALYTNAAITNLFYWNNLLHDVWWHYGFDEASGNFQQKNYGNTGFGNDFVNADAQDGSGTNNANFATPPDGQNPRMQMYIWNSAASGDYFQVNSPSTIGGKYNSNRANFGPQLTSTPITGNLVLVDDGTAAGDKGCNALVNSNEINGNIALVLRRDCNFTVKVKNAQNAGAKAVVIYSDNDNPILMGGTDNSINIPAVHITNTTGLMLRNNLSTQTLSVSLYDSSNIAASTFDSDFDNGIISHEYGHGISTRLTGGAASSSCLTNEEQMGEGWSDFFALVMTHEPNDEASDSRGIGTYAGNEPVTGGGIRPYPYSTNLSISPYSYDDIKTFSVPHGVGSVWCSMLWDLYWSMISKHGYDSNIYTGTGGNNMAMTLVIEGLKLQKCNPGFEDGRDAIILADKQLNNGSNELLIWQVFAARGLGYNASQGNSDSRSDGTEDYSIPPYLNKELLVSKRAPSSINNNQNFTYTIVANNKTPNTIENIEIKDTLNSYLKLVGSSVSCNASINGQVLTWTADSLSPGDSMVCSFDVTPSFDRVTELSWTDSVENGNGTWSASAASGNNGWEIVTTNKNSGLSSWFVPNDATVSDYSLTRSFDLRDINNPVLSFYHWINSESTWDGGVIELKSENGNWIDLENYFIKNGYNSVIQTNQSSAISDRAAFSGNSINFIESRLDLSSFKNSIVDIRFRFASDGAASEAGWYIDDLILEDAVTANNSVTATYGQNNRRQAIVSTIIRGEVMNNVSIPELNEISKVQIYPNPAEEQVTIQVSSSSNFSYSITAIDGKLITKGSFDKTIKIPVKGYSKGLFLVSVNQNRITTYHKLIIK